MRATYPTDRLSTLISYQSRFESTMGSSESYSGEGIFFGFTLLALEFINLVGVLWRLRSMLIFYEVANLRCAL